MANRIRTGDPRGFNKGRSSKFRVGSWVRQTPEEGQTYRAKRCENNHKDEDNNPKTLNGKKKTNNLIYHQSFVRTNLFADLYSYCFSQLNGLNYCNQTKIFLFNINHFFAHSEVVSSIVTFRSLVKQTTTRNIYNNIYLFSRRKLVWSRSSQERN